MASPPRVSSPPPPAPSSSAPSGSSSVPGSLPTSSGSRPTLRVRPGTRFSTLPTPAPEEEIKLDAFDGPYQLSEYLGRLVAQQGEGAREGKQKQVDRLVGVPGEGDGDAEDWVDADVWLYEHLLRLPPDLTPLITALLACCTPETCPDMRAGEWQYLCAAHPQLNINKDCAAIDYILHALDSITSMLNSSRVFPSRLSIPPTSRQNLKNIARRMSRIFGHAYSFHREAFEACEEETSLYRRFLALSHQYALVDERELAIPSERFTTDADSEDHISSGFPPVAEQEQEDDDDNVWGTRPDRSSTTSSRPSAAGSKRTVKEFDLGRGSSQEDDSDSSSSSDEDDAEADGQAGGGKADTISRGLNQLSLSPSTTVASPPSVVVPPTSPAPSPSSRPTAVKALPATAKQPTKSFLGSPILLSSPPPSAKTSPVNVTALSHSSPMSTKPRSPGLSPPVSSHSLSPSSTSIGPGKRTRTTTAIKSPSAGLGGGATYTIAAGGKSIGRSAGGRLVKAGTLGRNGAVQAQENGLGVMAEGGWREGREGTIE